jgi:hypothetical protein
MSMYMKSIVTLVLSLAAAASFANPVCDRASKAAERDGAMFSPAVGADVVGTGRLYFYTAPDESCKTPSTFVIPGDWVSAYAEYKDWYQISYLPKHGDHIEAWAHKDRLKVTGTLGPSDQ